MTQYLSQLSLARLLAASLTAGILLGLLYDLFRIRRLAFVQMAERQPSAPLWRGRLIRIADRLLLHTEDLLFGLTVGVVTVLLYFALSMGKVRLMALVGEGVGFLLYRLTLGRLVMAFADRLLRLIAWILRLVVRRIILPPLRLLSRLLGTLARAVMRRYARCKEKRYVRLGSREAIRYAEQLRALASAGFMSSKVKISEKNEKSKTAFFLRSRLFKRTRN